MLESNHGFDLSIAHGCLPTLKLPLEGLHSILFASGFLEHLVDDSERALAQQLQDLKPVSDDRPVLLRQILVVLGLQWLQNGT